MNAANEDVFVTVVVVIADRHAVVEAHARQAGLGGNIFEVALAVVFEEPVGVLGRALFQGLNVGSVGEKDIQIAVVVIVEDRYAAGHGFGRMALGRLATLEPEIDRMVNEMDGRLGVLAGSHGPRGGKQYGNGPKQAAPYLPVISRARRSAHGTCSTCRPGTLISGGGGSSLANSFTLANSESASCSRPRERQSLPRR